MEKLRNKQNMRPRRVGYQTLNVMRTLYSTTAGGYCNTHRL